MGRRTDRWAWASRVVLLAAWAAAQAGCTLARNCVPPDLTREDRVVDSSAQPGDLDAAKIEFVSAIAKRLAAASEKAAPGGAQARPACKLEFLALSGGGKFGAYAAGVLCGWSAAGTRPKFDMVTGVSTGALIAVYAYLGEDQDAELRRFYTTTATRDVVRPRPILAALLGESVFSSAPLKELIARQVTPEVMERLAAANREGRKLYVGTTNIDTKRLVIWDLGAIAAGGGPGRLRLVRDVLLASCSVPGGLPPVPIDVTIDGRQYTELHCDGGVANGLFLRPNLLPLRQAVTGARLHVIVSGKLYADPECVRPTALTMAAGGVSGLAYSMTRSDLVRLYLLALLTGMEYRATALDPAVEVTADTLRFDPPELCRLFDAGFQDGRSGASWRRTPPGTEGDEINRPRRSTDFRAAPPRPAAPMPSAPSVSN